jgi:hypothetical protein
VVGGGVCGGVDVLFRWGGFTFGVAVSDVANNQQNTPLRIHLTPHHSTGGAHGGQRHVRVFPARAGCPAARRSAPRGFHRVFPAPLLVPRVRCWLGGCGV